MLALILGQIGFINEIVDEKNSFKQFAENKVKELEQTIRDLHDTRTASVNLIEDLSNEIEKRRIAEESIGKAEKYFRSLIEKAPDGIVLVNEEGKMIYASPSAKRIFGYSADVDVFPSPMESTYPEDIPFCSGNH